MIPPGILAPICLANAPSFVDLAQAMQGLGLLVLWLCGYVLLQPVGWTCAGQRVLLPPIAELQRGRLHW